MKGRWIVALTAVAFLLPVTAKAGDMEEMKSRLEAMERTIASQKVALDRLSNQDTKRIQREEMAKLMEEIMEDAEMQAALPSWLENFKLYGDLRLRYQHTSRGWRAGGYTDSVAKDRNRLRFRVRLGFKKTWWDKQLEIGARFASGSSSDSDSTNQTFSGTFGKKDLWIDLAYAKYKPKAVKGLEIGAGKVKNPIKTKTKVSWDGDINPEGVYATYQMPFFGDIKPYIQGGYYILDEEGGSRDTTMVHYGAGVDAKVGDVKLFFGTSLYDFDHMDMNDNGGDAGYEDWWQEGGLSRADYLVWEMTTKAKWKMFGLPWEVWGTYLQNCADDYEVAATSGANSDSKFEGEDFAWGIGMKVGTNKKAGDWSVKYYYAYIGAFSWPTIDGYGFSDSDFGGPNTHGHVIGGSYSIDKFMQIGSTVLITEPIHSSGPGAEDNQGEDHSVTVQVDFKWKF